MGTESLNTGFGQAFHIVERIEHLEVGIELNVCIGRDLFDKIDTETDPFDKIAVIDIKMDVFKIFRLIKDSLQIEKIGGVDRWR